MAKRGAAALAHFEPVTGAWIERHFGEPTDIQKRTWPLIAAGRHLLVTAPTGSGKTLAAFLFSLDRLLSGAWEGGGVRVLYVSPLKALNNDIERNLLTPLAELERAFADAAVPTEPVRVRTRSGDTPSRERQAMLRHPPEILITTPESLNLLLTSPRGRTLLAGLKTVILDEIHAVAGGKRGVHLITAVERLVPLAGEFQRVALSATIKPVATMARFVGGYRRSGRSGRGTRRPRRVEVVSSASPKGYEIEVCRPPVVGTAAEIRDGTPANLWDELAAEFKGRIRDNRSTLVFANNRRTTERLTRLLNDGEPQEFVYSHHGSLSREIRALVEQRLKEGRLRGLVATNSLELGIDIGALDEVLLVRTPPTIASAVQRIGRAGHRVGEVSRGRFYPLFGRDLLEAAVVARAVEAQDIEEIRPVEGALDVLAQVILSMTANDTWNVEELYEELRRSFPYRRLGRRQFDLVLEMLTGRYADSRIRELEPRILWDRVDGSVRGRRGTARLVYQSGGTIPDRGYFHLRLADSMAKLGELDEEFVWERSLGDTFTLGAQNWRIRRITHNDVLVSPAMRSAAMAPFWRAEERDRSFHLSQRIGEFLEAAEATLAISGGGTRLQRRLEEDHRMSAEAASDLVAFLERQRSISGRELPHRRHLLAERVRGERPEPHQLVLHTGWGGRVNRPLAIALAAAWEQRHGASPRLEHDNDSLLLATSMAVEIEELLDLVRPDNLEALLRRRLESTGFFGARFRENAGRALLLPRSGRGRRVPLWLQRERGKELLRAIRKYDDFPVLVETWRACLQDAFEMETLKQLLDEVAAGDVRIGETTTGGPSPFAADLVWKQTSRLMYEDDAVEAGAGAGVSTRLLREVVFSSGLRPRLPSALIATFERKLQRLHRGYAPRSAGELVSWVEERVLIPDAEWQELMAAMARDAGGDGRLDEIRRAAARRLGRIDLGDGAVVAGSTAARLARAFETPVSDLPLAPLAPGMPLPSLPRAAAERSSARVLEELVAEWSRAYGPYPPERLERVFGLDRGRVEEVLAALVDAETMVVDRFRADAEQVETCDADNLERLIRLLRARSRPAFTARAVEELPLFLASQHGLGHEWSEADDLKRALERLLFYAAPARLWETEIFPARLDPYYPEWLDALLQETELTWQGCGSERICFLFAADRELLRDGRRASTGEDELDRLFADAAGRYGFEEMLAGGLGSAELTRRLWQWTWQGRVANTTFSALRKGVLMRFAAHEPREASGRQRRRGRFDRWQTRRPFVGDWYRIAEVAEPADELEVEEQNRERMRVLLDRYGVVFRELLARELPAFRWGALFRSLRLMELSGEVLSGHFFDGIDGPQFASRGAYRRLSDGLARDTVYWLSAADPASPCGLGLDAFRGKFPARRPWNHLVFHGSRLVLVSRRGGARLSVRVAPDHPELPRYWEFFKVRLTRRFDPMRAIDVEAINGVAAAMSPYASALGDLFEITRVRSGLRLRRRY